MILARAALWSIRTRPRSDSIKIKFFPTIPNVLRGTFKVGSGDDISDFDSSGPTGLLALDVIALSGPGAPTPAESEDGCGSGVLVDEGDSTSV